MISGHGSTRGRWAVRLALVGLALGWAALGWYALVHPSHAATTLWTLATWCGLGGLVAIGAWTWATSAATGDQVALRSDIARPVIVSIIALETIAIAFTLATLG